MHRFAARCAPDDRAKSGQEPKGDAMRLKTRILFAGCLLILGLHTSAAVADGQTKIDESGSTVITATSPKGRASVTIQTARLEGECASACAASRSWKERGAEEVNVVQSMDFSVDGHPLAVPTSVFATLSDLGRASLRFEKGSFVLEITTGDGALSSFVRIYFDATGINRQIGYSSLSPDTPLEDTRYYHVVLN